MDYVKIDGKAYDVIVSEIGETFNILYSENTGRTLSQGARMTLDPIGTFYGHKVTFQRKEGLEAEYDALFAALSKPRYDGMDVEIVHNQTTLTYEAYVSQGERSLARITSDGRVLWGEFVATFTPMEAQVLPS